MASIFLFKEITAYMVILEKLITHKYLIITRKQINKIPSLFKPYHSLLPLSNPFAIN